MTNPKRRTIPALMAGALGMGGALAMAAEPTQQELMGQIQELQAKVAALENSKTAGQDVDATVASVLDDADRRSQLMQVEGFTAGHNKGRFTLQSADGNFTLSPMLQFQFRNVTNLVEDDSTTGDDEIEHGFEVRRMKFGFEGNMFTPDLKYVFVWATDRDGGSVFLEDAYVTYKFADAWALKAGQFKDPVHHEELTSSKRQLAVDRSLLNEVLGGGVTDRVQGVGLIYDDGGPLRAEVVLHDGADTDNTDFTDSGGTSLNPAMPPPNYGVSGRIEYLVMGNYKAYQDFTAMGNEDDLLVIGGGLDWTQSGSNNEYFHTVDAQWENTAGLGVYAAYVGVLGDLSDSDVLDPGSLLGEDSPYDWGLILQAGYMLNDQWEVFARYDFIDSDKARVSPDQEDEIHELTLGVNYYLKGHAAKITVDGFWLPDGSPFDVDGIGVQDNDGNDQFGLRGQFQLLI